MRCELFNFPAIHSVTRQLHKVAIGLFSKTTLKHCSGACFARCLHQTIDLLAILQKSLDRAIFLYNFIHEARQSGVTASITIVHIRKFYKS